MVVASRGFRPRLPGDPDVENMINIRDLSVRCGRCNTYQTLVAFEHGDGFNSYTYECENRTCAPEATRTIVEVPEVLDLFFQAPSAGGRPDHGELDRSDD